MENSLPKKPDFICIGAQKAGTSWLHWNLLFHPETSLPPLKEIHYFLYLMYPFRTRLADYLWRGQSLIRSDSWKQALHKLHHESFQTDPFYNEEWYRFFLYRRRTPANFRKLFQLTGHKVTGSLCPALGGMPESVIRAYAKAAPEAKILYILRDPLARAWSQLRMMHGEALKEKNPEQIANHINLAVEHSLYARNIARWEKYFPGKLHLFFYEDLVADPLALYKEICAKLGIGPLTDFKNNKLGERIHVSPEVDISPEISTILRKRLLPDAQALHERIGNAHTKQWLEAMNA